MTRILYLASVLPSRSETFVYREIFALRELGLEVLTASVNAPMRELGEPELEALAESTLELYSKGPLRLLADFAAELVTHPLRGLATLGRVLGDALFSRDVPMSRRPKVVWQGVAGIALARRLRSRGIAHIHAHFAHVPATIAMYAALQLDVGWSFTGHANDLFPNRTLLREKLERARFVSCISLWHRSFYRSIAPREERAYPIVRCGVDTASYEPTAAPADASLHILGVGRLVEKKGFDVLLRAAGELARQGVGPIRVTIAGGGPREAALREIVAGLPEDVHVELLGDTPNPEIIERMGNADVFALPCRVAVSGDRDGIPVVLMEAMARGRCVVTGDLESVRELVEDGVTGIMIPPGDQAALEKALTELARDRARIDALGRAARRRVEKEFDLMLNARRILGQLAAEGLATPPVD